MIRKALCESSIISLANDSIPLRWQPSQRFTDVVKSAYSNQYQVASAAAAAGVPVPTSKAPVTPSSAPEARADVIAAAVEMAVR